MTSIGLYECVCCGISTRNKSVYRAHVATKKHTKRVVGNPGDANKEPVDCECGKQFSYRSNYYRHRKECYLNNQKVDGGMLTKEWIVQLVHENEELRKMLVDDRKYMETQYRDIMNTQTRLVELCNQPRTIHSNTTTIHRQTNHAHFNLQLFLNVQCKDAVNLSDFIRNLQIDYSDIERLGRIGYTEGMTRILVDGLKDLETHRRPIHCTDVKREIVYVKEENQWNIDKNHDKMMRAIEQIGQKNCRIMCKYITSDMVAGDDEDSAKKFKMMVETNGGISSEDRDRSKSRIVRNVSKEMYLDKMLGDVSNVC
jgi:hypothetical protein